jgi:hypothetical protein
MMLDKAMGSQERYCWSVWSVSMEEQSQEDTTFTPYTDVDTRIGSDKEREGSIWLNKV